MEDNTRWDVRASKLAQNTQNPIREIFERWSRICNPEKTSIPLSIGDPTVFGNLAPPTDVYAAVREVLELKESRSYGPTFGHLAARKAIAEYSLHQGKVTADDVILASGCTHAIEMVLTSLANPGQNVLVPRPGHLVHKTIGESSGIRLKYYDLLPDEEWQVDLQSLENQIDCNSTAIVVNNPSNPCGSVYSREHLKSIIAVASRHCLPIIADEIYEHFVFDKHEYVAISSLSDDVPVLTCSGITKRFLVPGWRIGWVIIHDRHGILAKEFRQGLMNMPSRLLGPNTLIQQALPRILKDTPHSYFQKMMLFVENQAKLAYQELDRCPGLRPIMPQGSMYMMIEIKLSKFPKIEDEKQFVKQLYSEQSVLCIPGYCFNYSNFMRIVLTVPEDILREACQRINEFCKDHGATNDVTNIKDKQFIEK